MVIFCCKVLKYNTLFVLMEHLDQKKSKLFSRTYTVNAALDKSIPDVDKCYNYNI